MPTAALQTPLISPEEFISGEIVAYERHEFLNGVVYAMAGGTLRHSRIVMGLYHSLLNQLYGKSCEILNSDTMIKAQLGNDLRFYYPDASIVCQPASESARVQDSPVALFEVLSPSTRRIDEGEKLRAYLNIPSLKAYVLIDSEIRRVTVWKQIQDQWEAAHFSRLEDSIDLDFVGCRLKVSELYERVTFE